MLGARRVSASSTLKGIFRRIFASSTLTQHFSSSSTRLEPTQSEQVDFYHHVQQVLANPNAYEFVEILKSCTKSMYLDQGNLIYLAVVEECLDTNLFLGNILITLYEKCNCLEDAQAVFARMPLRNVVTWNSIMSGRSKHGQDLVVFDLFWRMQLECLRPDKFTYVSILKACWSIDSLCQGKVIHTLILGSGLQEDVYVGSALVHMYAIYSLETACIEFENFPNKNVVTWNAMITAFIKDGQNQMALSTFARMHPNKVQSNDVTFINVLKAITSIESLSFGLLAHALIIEANFELNVMIGTTLIDMYAKCNSLKDAEEVFKGLSKACAVTWSALLAGYVENGNNVEALNLFRRMHNGLALNSVIYVSLLEACSELAVAYLGLLIHALIVESGCQLEDFIRNALISMHMKLGSSWDACFVFDLVPNHSVVTWSAMIEGYAELGCGKEALALFQRMLQHGARPNNVTFLSVLKACSSLLGLNAGKLVHIQVRESGVPANLAVGNTLIDMYAKCGSIKRALKVFNEMPKQSVCTWNAIMTGYLHRDHGWEALHLFQRMQAEGVEPNNITFINILRACCCISALREGSLIHINAIYYNIEMDAVLQSALIDFYVKHGCLEDAERQFDKSSKQDRVPCNAMITGYAQHGCCYKAFGLLFHMLKEAIKPDIVTFIALLRACSTTTALVKGKLVHQYAMQSVNSSSLIVGNALIDMYAKCGSISDAQKVFDGLVTRDIISWTALIAGYALEGDIDMAMQCFIKMQEEGLKPNDATFISVLSACGHAGLMNQAVLCVEEMRAEHHVLPAIDHNNTMVDVLGREGRLVEAEDFMKTTPFVTDTVGWASLLSHCQTHVNVSLGKHTFFQFLSLDGRHASAYMQMAVLLMHGRGGGNTDNIEACRDRLAA